ncbi:MAG: family 10 glycosylhydrolase [Phycisphaerales bacterium]|nr:MAG: family 10 glycosylhydrolase [Phycisphaerales bacterium]
MYTNRGFATAVSIGIAALLAPCARTARAQDPEFRAMWASRFEWPDPNEATCKATIDAIMQDLASANFNAVFFQIRGQADVLYPSPYEVWSPLIGGSDPGWDPLAYAVAAAHANGIEFHAYINTHPCWQSSSHVPPTNLDHLFYDHCNASDVNARDWLHHNVPDNPVQFSESDYVWMAPGVPAFQAYIRQQILYVVENYDVDGVHFDRIRTPWSGQPSYDPISLARFNDSQSNPDALDFTEWTADQITRNVRDIYAAVMAVKPYVKVSAAVYSNPNTAPTAQHQDALAWAQTGGMDILVPMMYFSGGEGSTWDDRLLLWLAGSAGRHVVAGHITSQGLNSLLEQIALTRTRSAQGNSVFSWSSFDWWSDYVNSVYQNPATLPPMAWKDTPTDAVIWGYVTDAVASPVVDAQIQRSDSAYTGLSTGDGFYSFLLVPPGTYTLTASHPGYGTVVVPGVSVVAGDVVRQDIAFGTVLPPIIAEVTPDPDSVVQDEEYTRHLTLTQGVADSWMLMDGPSGADVDATGYVSGWTPSAGDVGQSFLFTVRASNTVGFDDESWNVLVSATPPCDDFTITDFEGYTNGTRVLFNKPRYSGSTVNDLEDTPDVAEVTDAVDAFSPTKSYLVQWQYLDTDPQRWMRLTTHNASNVPNPTVTLDRPIRVRLRVDAGRFRLAAGVRETATTADIGQDGGSSGTIEWIGAASDVNGAPQGVLVEPMPGEWQTFLFDPLSDPIHGMTGDGTLWTSTGKGVFEHLAFSVVDTVGPFTVYIDDVELLCDLPAFGDLNRDGEVDEADYLLFEPCLQGPETTVSGDCQTADADDDGDVDLADYAAFEQAFSQ